MLRLGYRRRKLAHVPTITFLPESQPRQGFVEEADFQAIVKHLDDDVHLAATIAFETAWRIRAEVLTLSWARVDVTEGLHPARRRALEEREAAQCVPESRRHRGVGHTPGPGGQGARSHPGTRLRRHTGKGRHQGRRILEFKKQWQSACRKAGYAGGFFCTIFGGPRCERWARAAVPESVAMKISGSHHRGGIQAVRRDLGDGFERSRNAQGTFWAHSAVKGREPGSLNR